MPKKKRMPNSGVFLFCFVSLIISVDSTLRVQEELHHTSVKYDSMFKHLYV